MGDLGPPAGPPWNYPANPAWLSQSTPAASIWPPPTLPSRATPTSAGDELANLMRGLMGAQANDSGWPTFSGKYAEYPRFRKEWWAYRHTYHGHVRDELVCRGLKERSLASSVKILVNDIEDLRRPGIHWTRASTHPRSTLRRLWSQSLSSGATRCSIMALSGNSIPCSGRP
jgi:hypothetical protein